MLLNSEDRVGKKNCADTAMLYHFETLRIQDGENLGLTFLILPAMAVGKSA